jgi:hypothetical protein
MAANHPGLNHRYELTIEGSANFPAQQGSNPAAEMTTSLRADDIFGESLHLKPADQLAVPKVADALAWAGEVFAGR